MGVWGVSMGGVVLAGVGAIQQGLGAVQPHSSPGNSKLVPGSKRLSTSGLESGRCTVENVDIATVSAKINLRLSQM